MKNANYYTKKIIILISEEVKLIGEGEYNLNTLKEIKVSDSYLGLDQDERGCQDEEPLYNCSTRHYMDALIDHCGCLPFNIKLSDKVLFKSTYPLAQL